MTSRIIKTSCFGIALAAGCLSLSSAQTPINSSAVTSKTATKAAPANRLWNLQNADILSVIDAVSHETGKNFIIDPRVQGKVTLVSSQPMSPEEVYQVFLAILQTHGYAAVSDGKFIKILPDIEAKQQSAQLSDGSTSVKGAQMVVQVVPVKNVPVDQLVRMLHPLLPQSADISAYAPSNILIISANADKLQDLMTLINRVDSTNSTGMEIVPLKNASASELVTTINTLQQANNRFGVQPSTLSLAADERSNSILLNGDNASRAHMRDLIKQLDRPNPNSGGNTSVIYLRYLNAKDFAPVLRGIINGTAVDESSSASTASSNSATDTTNPSNNILLRTNNAPPLNMLPGSNSSSTSSTDSPTGANKAQIQAETNTNALIISAPPAVMASLRNVIKQLDVRPAQVLVEAVIVEISESRMQELGIQWGTHADPGTAPSNDTFSNLTGGQGFGFINSGNIRALVTALASDTSSNILATPSLLVLDNQKADIKVGQQVPTQTGSLANTAANNNVVTTTDYKDVVLELKVTPQINIGGTVRLNIEQGNDTVSGQTGIASNPIFNTAQIRTQVMVNSGQILVLGGLLNNDFEQTKDRVPILSSIPGLGALFTNKNHTLNKKNLVVFLQPIILRDTQLANQITDKKYDAARAAQLLRQKNAGPFTPIDANPVLPPRQKPLELPLPFKN